MNESLRVLCDGLVNNFNLKVLDLQNNSLGGSEYDQKYYGQKLIRIINDKHSNMKHLDLSYNRFIKAEAIVIAKELKENFYLYGFHFEGNPCNFIINSRGFLVESKKPFEEQGRGIFQRNIRMNDFKNVSEIYKENFYKDIHGQDAILENQKINNQQQQKTERTNLCKSGEICWICDEYKEIKFTFKLNYKINREPIYIHLNFEGYEPFRMEQDSIDKTKYFAYRMCPPNCEITYFFSNPFINQVSILPYNQIRSESNPMNILLSKNLMKQSTKTNSLTGKNQKLDNKANENPISKILNIDYTDIKNYVIPLPYLMNVYKQTINNPHIKNYQLPYQTDIKSCDGTPNYSYYTKQNKVDFPIDRLDSAEALNQQISQISERRKQEYSTHINNDEFDKNEEGEIVYVYKKKICNVLNDNYDPIIRSKIRQVQKPYLEQPQSAKELKKNGWNVKNSVFSEFRGDDYLFLKNCFEFDWSSSKLNKMVRSEDDKENLKQVLYDIYPQLKNAYKQLACQNIYGEVFAISNFLFSDFISQTKIIDGKLIKLSDIDFNFIATNAQKEKNSRNPDRALIRYQFMEVLVRIAFDKYIKNKAFSNFSDAFKQILNEEDLLKILINIPDPQTWRETRLWTPQCDQLIRQKMEFFKRVYEKWAGSKNKEKKIFTTVKVMSCSEFKEWIGQQSVFVDQLNEKEQNEVFSNSMMTQIDEVTKERHMQMQFIEFIEAFARLADKVSPVPYGEDKQAYTKEELIQLPLHMKIESIIALIDGNKTIIDTSKNTHNQPKYTSRSSLSALNIKDTSFPKINSKNILDSKSITQMQDNNNEVKIPSQIKLGFKGFMLAKSLKKRLINNKQNLQELNGGINKDEPLNKSLKNIEEDI